MLKYFIDTIIIIFLVYGTAFADFYKWEDESGVTHITDYPPPETSAVKNMQVHKKESAANNNSAFTNKNKQNSSNSKDSFTTQKVDPQEQIPQPYNCIKLCLQENRNARKACIGDRDNHRSCVKRNKEQLDNCRKKCHEEDNYAASGHFSDKKNARDSNSNKTVADTSVSSGQTADFNIIDKRDPAEREGYPYPKSPFSYIMHGDHSLDVDRLAILNAKLNEQFGSKLKGKTILLTRFYVMEKTVRPSFIKNDEGKQIPYNGPFLPTLISEIMLVIDNYPFSGSGMLQMNLGSKAKKSALSIATTKTVDDLIKDIERRGGMR